MNPVFMAHTAVVTPLGSDLDVFFKALLNKKTAIKPVHRFDTDNYISPYAALIDHLSMVDKRSMVFGLADKLIGQLPLIPEDTFLFTASTKSGIDVLEKSHKGMDLDKSQMIISSLPEYISRKLRLKDCGINISSACASSTIAVAKAASLIASGRADSILICCMDVISEFVFSGFSAIQAMSPEPSTPFDVNRKGLTLGEGGAAILLLSEKMLKQYKNTEIASIAGWGIANDACHITAPAKDGCGLKLAISKALAKAKIKPDQIDAISSHGTGTVYNDAMELTAIRSLFGSRDLPVNSIKGSIGHTLGAAGGIEIALGAKMLANGIVPGTVGLNHMEERAKGMLSLENQYFSGEYLLSVNSGFGGINAALILKRKSI